MTRKQSYCDQWIFGLELVSQVFVDAVWNKEFREAIVDNLKDVLRSSNKL